MRVEVSVVPLEGSAPSAAMVGRAGFPGWARTSLQLLSAETAGSSALKRCLFGGVSLVGVKLVGKAAASPSTQSRWILLLELEADLIGHV